MTAADLSPAEAARVAAFDAAPVPPEVLREQVATAIMLADIDDLEVDSRVQLNRVEGLWLKADKHFPEDTANYRLLADAALAVVAGQPHPAVQRVRDEARADALMTASIGLPGTYGDLSGYSRDDWGNDAETIDEWYATQLRDQAHAIRAAIRGEGQ